MENHHLALPAGYRIENYEIQAVLGKGGFGITYVAYDWTLGRHMAIKELLPDTIATRIDGSTVVAMGPSHEESWQWARERFVEEARILAGFRHPNIIAVHRLIEANGTVYLVMDHLEGESYETRLRRIGHEPDQTSLMAVIGPLLDGLQEVHAAGLLHRDIKPENILFDNRGNPVLIDFGAARATVGATMTMTSIVTHGYSPIEQYQTKGKMGPWTDIYAIAAVMCRAITGEKPPAAADRLTRDDFQLLSQRYLPGFSHNGLLAIDAALSINIAERPSHLHDWRKSFIADFSLKNSKTLKPSAAEVETNCFVKKPKQKLIKVRVVSFLIVFGLVCATIILTRQFQSFRKSIELINAISLGKKRQDILYLLGWPDSVLERGTRDGTWLGESDRVYYVNGPAGDNNTMPSNTHVNDYYGWVYDKSSSRDCRFTLNFDQDGEVNFICLHGEASSTIGWGPVAGIKYKDKEKDILRLGKPTNVSIDKNNGTKVIEYEDIGLSFYLTKGEVYMVICTHSSNGIASNLKRYIHTLIP